MVRFSLTSALRLLQLATQVHSTSLLMRSQALLYLIILNRFLLLFKFLMLMITMTLLRQKKLKQLPISVISTIRMVALILVLNNFQMVLKVLLPRALKKRMQKIKVQQLGSTIQINGLNLNLI